MVVDDPDVLELGPPLPGSATGARVTYKGPKQGWLRQEPTVPRSQATHAVLHVFEADGWEREEVLEPAEADEWLADVAEFRSRVADRRAELAAEASEAPDAARGTPECPRCVLPRQHAGRLDIVVADAPAQIHKVATGKWRPRTVGWDEWVCPSCGSVELFRSGPEGNGSRPGGPG